MELNKTEGNLPLGRFFFRPAGKVRANSRRDTDEKTSVSINIPPLPVWMRK